MNGEVKKILTQAGWYEGRCVDITAHLKWYASEGYQIPKNVHDFLTAFGDLDFTLSRPYFRNGSRQVEMIRFITVPEDNGFEFEFIGDYNRYFKADMYPIAASHTVYDYFMDTEGGIYAFYGNIGAKWGESFEDFILNIIRGTTREFENIKAQHKEQI